MGSSGMVIQTFLSIHLFPLIEWTPDDFFFSFQNYLKGVDTD